MSYRLIRFVRPTLLLIMWTLLSAVSLVTLQVCPEILIPIPFPLINQCSTWTLLTAEAEAVTGFLSSLSQFAAVPVTLALGVIVLVIQLQAGALTNRAGAIVLRSTEFLLTAALLFASPIYCILLLGVLDYSQSTASPLVRTIASTAIVPVGMTFIYLARFTSNWFRMVSPAAFTGLVAAQVVQGLRERNRDSVSLAVRALGESLNNLSRSVDHMGVRLCAGQIGLVLSTYLTGFKSNMPDEFFIYQWPERRLDREWVEQELCTSVKDASDALMLRGGPAQTINYLTEQLVPLGDAAAQLNDLESMRVLACAFIEIGASEKAFMNAINFNMSPLHQSANLALRNLKMVNTDHAVSTMAACFFFLFAWVEHRTQNSNATSSVHLSIAKKAKDSGIDFGKAERKSHKLFRLYWQSLIPDPRTWSKHSRTVIAKL